MQCYIAMIWVWQGSKLCKLTLLLFPLVRCRPDSLSWRSMFCAEGSHFKASFCMLCNPQMICWLNFRVHLIQPKHNSKTLKMLSFHQLCLFTHDTCKSIWEITNANIKVPFISSALKDNHSFLFLKEYSWGTLVITKLLEIFFYLLVEWHSSRQFIFCM